MTGRTTRPGALEEHPPERRYMKFDPTINSGTLLQIGIVVVSVVMFTVTIKGELQTQKVEIEANKLAAERDNKKNEEALKELKSDVRELQKSVNDIKEGVAILRGRASDTGAKR